MTPDQVRQLNRMIWQRRLRMCALPVAAIVGVLGLYGWLAGAKMSKVDRVVEAHEVGGEVMSAARLTGRKGGFMVHVRLAGGKEVDAYSQLPLPPLAGEAVELREAAHASGRVTYDVVRIEAH
ncbi:MAG: hypothetical protein VX871_06550 [Pseudomonadota bacterium]|nr:hypothetical protein [Pseudomonadota bacterium]